MISKPIAIFGIVISLLTHAVPKHYSVYNTPGLSELQGQNISIYCAESQDGITLEPSYSVTWAEGTYVDPETGIRKNSRGDYLCAMGTGFGYCGDRFLVICRKTSYTVQIGDSKGDKWYDVYGDPSDPVLGPISGYCLIEFIVDMDIARPLISRSGSYHTTGLIPTDIVFIVPLGN